MTVLTRTAKPTKLNVVVDGPKQFGSFRGHYMLFGGFPKLNVRTDRASAKARYDAQQAAAVQFPSKGILKAPPTERHVAILRREPRLRFPYIEEAANDPKQRLYHLEYSGDNILLPVFFDRETDKPTPQVVVIARTLYWNAQVKESSWRVKGATRAYMRALDDRAVIDLNVKSRHARYWMPTTVRITDANGKVVIDSSVFMSGDRKEVDVKLDPKANPSPWKVEMASSGDCAVTFKGADELFFAVKREDFDEILPLIPVHTPDKATAP